MSKYVRLMADHCSSGVWDKDGVNIDIDSLPIHFWLKTMINEWQAKYDHECNDWMDEEEAAKCPFDYKTFSKHGYALAVKLKQNLPDWTVMYFDEAAAWENKPRSEFLKEIVL